MNCSSYFISKSINCMVIAAPGRSTISLFSPTISINISNHCQRLWTSARSSKHVYLPPSTSASFKLPLCSSGAPPPPHHLPSSSVTSWEKRPGKRRRCGGPRAHRRHNCFRPRPKLPPFQEDEERPHKKASVDPPDWLVFVYRLRWIQGVVFVLYIISL